MIGKEAVSGTTFRGQERTVAQGRGSHDRKRGKRAKFIEEIYRKYIIPQMKREIMKGDKFLATLSVEDLQWLSEQLSQKAVNDKGKQILLSRKAPTREELDVVRDVFKRGYAKQGNKQLVEIIKDEFKDSKINIGINVANKQKNLVELSDKILSIFQFVFANPQGFQQAMQIPALANSFNDILEFSGLNQADFLSLTQPPEQAPQEPPQPPQKAPEPLQLNTKQNATAQ